LINKNKILAITVEHDKQSNQMNHKSIDIYQHKFSSILSTMGGKPYFWFCLLILLVVPFRVMTYNYKPIDDAKRHVGKVFSGKEWSEILVMREDVQGFDHNMGWHNFLELIQKSGVDEETLLIFSCIFLFLVFVTAGLFLFNSNPFAWMVAISIGCLSGSINRLMLGRPFLFSSTVFLLLLYTWDDENACKCRCRFSRTIILICLTGYIHGAWHLFVFLPASLFLSGRLKDALFSGTSWLIGSLLAGVLTLRPLDFLWKQIYISYESTGRTLRTRFLVGEYQPVHTLIPLLLLGLFFALTRKGSTSGKKDFFVESAILLGWGLGLMNGRFWNDWGNVALVYHTAKFVNKNNIFIQNENQLLNINLKVLSVVCFYFLYTSDVGSRWSNHDFVDSLRLDDPLHVEWLPAPGGILYSDDMTIFYDTFFHNPHGEWKYILGFEPTFMPIEDLENYRNIQFYGTSHPNVFDPWVEKMTEVDRLILRAPKTAQPIVNGLEWKYIAFNTWSGRLSVGKDSDRDDVNAIAPPPDHE